MSPASATALAAAEAVYTETLRPAFPYWPKWANLRRRTQDLFAAGIAAATYDRDRPVKRPALAQNGAKAPAPSPATPASRPAPHANAERYAAGAPDPAGVLLNEAGFKPG